MSAASHTPATIRLARPEDFAELMRIRHAVRENRLVSMVIGPADYHQAILVEGCGWVAETAAGIVAFAVGNRLTGNIWALFVDPAHAGQGHGRRLHDVMVAWLFEQGLQRLWLSTDPGTRAERFYLQAGWTALGLLPDGEMLFERLAPAPT